MINRLVLGKIFLLTLLSFFLLAACSDEKSAKRSALKGLSDTLGDFEQPTKDHVITFEQAQAPHKKFQQEWWYLTANLTTESGEELAAQWTLFRRAVEDKHWYFAHAALADANQHQSAFRSGREELGNVEITTQPFKAVIDNWQWQSTQELLPAKLRYGNVISANTEQLLASPSKQQPLANKLTVQQSMSAKPIVAERAVEGLAEQAQRWQVNLNLRLDEALIGKTPYFLQGENGFSQKHHTLAVASYYYSQPFINVSGEVFWQNKWQKVIGNAWFDREWGSQMLAEDQQGWDWFSLRLNENTALMVYRIRSDIKDYLYGSIMRRDGTIKTLSSSDISLTRIKANTKSQSSGDSSRYPEQFSIVITQDDIDIEVRVINNKQIMRFGLEYFEGMVKFSGSHQGSGFLEMTGYVN
ncbi:MAG: putative secreted hydrolase [Colwellia sp.]|jgi:predicted secreted hydrolase